MALVSYSHVKLFLNTRFSYWECCHLTQDTVRSQLCAVDMATTCLLYAIVQEHVVMNVRSMNRR